MYHRIENGSTQTDALAEIQRDSGEIWGSPPRGSYIPTVQAFEGPLRTGDAGIEFITNVQPDSGGVPGGDVRWRTTTPGITTRTDPEREEFAVLPVRVTRIVYRNAP